MLIDFDSQGSSSLYCNVPIWDSTIPNIGDLITPFALYGKRASIDDILNSITRGKYEKTYQEKGKFGWKHKIEEYPFDILPVCGTEISIGELAIHNRESFIYQNVEYSYFMLKLITDTIAEECNYDYVIIDSPPLGAVIDTAIISKVCDGAILVIECMKVSAKLVSKVVSQLRMANCRILGTVLNKVERTKDTYYAKFANSSELVPATNQDK